MLAIHGVWAHGALYVWAEESGSSAAGQAGPRPISCGATRPPLRLRTGPAG